MFASEPRKINIFFRLTGWLSRGYRLSKSLCVKVYVLCVKSLCLRLKPPVTTSLPGAQNAKKVSKMSLGPVGPECQKSAKKAAKVSKKSHFGLFVDFLGTFLVLLADRPEKTFLRLFWHFGPGRPVTPSNWSLQSQAYVPFFAFNKRL